MNYILLILGFFLLIKGADYFIDGSSYIAKILKVPSLIIGLTIVAFGTSAPEAAVSITASIDGQNGMAIGNVIGSNIFNLLMVVGSAGFVRTLQVEKSILNKEFPFLLFSSTLVIILGADSLFKNNINNTLGHIDGTILLILFVIFLYKLVNKGLKSKNITLEEISISSDTEILSSTVKQSMPKSIVYSVIGILSIIVGAKLVVSTGSYIASTFGVSDQLIGLTIVSIGTSLPEFVTSIVASTKGESDIALGNVIGSNIFNILFILGVSSFISPITIQPQLILDGIFMILVTILTYIFAFRKQDVNKFESLTLIGLYLAYITYLIMNG